MNYPGSNRIVLTVEALREAVESAINASRREGEDYVHVTSIKPTYSYASEYEVCITTDKPPIAVALRDQEAA